MNFKQPKRINGKDATFAFFRSRNRVYSKSTAQMVWYSKLRFFEDEPIEKVPKMLFDSCRCVNTINNMCEYADINNLYPKIYSDTWIRSDNGIQFASYRSFTSDKRFWI